MKGVDRKRDFDQAIERSKSLAPLFAPGTTSKAHYSDTNFQLLGRIVEVISGKSIPEVFRELIFYPLGLVKTYLYDEVTDQRPKNLYYKDAEFYIPKAIASVTGTVNQVADPGTSFRLMAKLIQRVLK